MARLLWGALLGLLLVTAGATDSEDDGGDPTTEIKGVVELTPKDFATVLNGDKAAFVEFYAPWCGHCKQLVPKLAELAALVAADPDLKGRVTLAKVNADDHEDIGRDFKVHGYPTLKFFPRGKPAAPENANLFKGLRDPPVMLRFIKRRILGDKGFARVKALDGAALRVGKAAAAEVAKAADDLAAAAKDVGEAERGFAEVYVQLARKAVEKGPKWLAAERSRLERLLAAGSVPASKQADFVRKVSVLGGFVGEEVAPAEVSAKLVEEEEDDEELSYYDDDGDDDEEEEGEEGEEVLGEVEGDEDEEEDDDKDEL